MLYFMKIVKNLVIYTLLFLLALVAMVLIQQTTISISEYIMSNTIHESTRSVLNLNILLMLGMLITFNYPLQDEIKKELKIFEDVRNSLMIVFFLRFIYSLGMVVMLMVPTVITIILLEYKILDLNGIVATLSPIVIFLFLILYLEFKASFSNSFKTS